jgi:hypothetical protein
MIELEVEKLRQCAGDGGEATASPEKRAMEICWPNSPRACLLSSGSPAFFIKNGTW